MPWLLFSDDKRTPAPGLCDKPHAIVSLQETNVQRLVTISPFFLCPYVYKSNLLELKQKRDLSTAEMHMYFYTLAYVPWWRSSKCFCGKWARFDKECRQTLDTRKPSLFVLFLVLFTHIFKKWICICSPIKTAVLKKTEFNKLETQ